MKIAIAAAALAAMIPLGANAAPNCAPTGQMVEQLRDKYHERPLFWLHLANGSVMQLWGNPSPMQGEGTNGWTIVIHGKTGGTCVLLAGKGLPEWTAEVGGLPS